MGAKFNLILDFNVAVNESLLGDTDIFSQILRKDDRVHQCLCNMGVLGALIIFLHTVACTLYPGDGDKRHSHKRRLIIVVI